MKKRLNLENLYTKFGKVVSSCLAVALPNIPGCPKMPNFGTFFSNFETFFSLLGSSYPSETLELGFYASYELASPFSQNWRSYFSFFFKKKVRNQKSQNIEKFQNWIFPKLSNPGFCTLTCVLMWGTSLFMLNFVILKVFE